MSTEHSLATSSTQRGDDFENRIFLLITNEINNDRFAVSKDRSRIYRKKGYYSKDREREIIFDLSIEVFAPGADDYSFIFLIECKNTKRPVSIDDAEEFFTKTQQVGAANSKAILATSSSFQSGVITYARSKKIGLIRSPDPETLHWELRRSPSASTITSSSRYVIEAALTEPHNINGPFDLYLLTKARPTNSLWEFFFDLLTDGTMGDDLVLSVLNNHRPLASTAVAFLEKADLEARSLHVLEQIDYKRGVVNLDAICAREQKTSGLSVLRLPNHLGPSRREVLGSITFQPPTIELFEQPTPHLGRERFTLAHELGHWFLDHQNYMIREFCEKTDIDTGPASGIADSDIGRLEFQANFFASCLLMPRQVVLELFIDTTRMLSIPDRGFGKLYVDDQPINIHNYKITVGRIASQLHVSRQACSIRLSEMGLLTDDR